MAEVSPGRQRFETVLARIAKKLNDALNRPPSEVAQLAVLQAQLVVARRVAAEQNLSERDALIQAGSAALSFEQLQNDITTEEQAPPLPGAQPPQREVYTTEDAGTFLADSQVMVEQLFFDRTGNQPDRTTQRIIGAYLIENLLGDQRGAPTSFTEEFAEQVVSLQGEAVIRDPERVTQGQRLRAGIDALLASDNPNAQIDQETFNALVFPSTSFADLPARFRGGIIPSVASGREAELRATNVVEGLSSNMLANLQKVVDITGGPTGVSNFREAFARVASEQTEEQVLAGTATLPSVNSPSEIRAQRRQTEALGALEDETSIKKAVEAEVGSPGLETDSDRKRDKTQAVRVATDRIQEARRGILQANPGISDEELDAQLAPALAQEVESFDQTLAVVTQEFETQKFRDLEGTKTELKAILGREGLDASQIDDELLTRTAQFVMESENPNVTAQSIVGAFPALLEESIRLETVGDLDLAKKSITSALGEVGLDAKDIPEDIFEGLAFSAVQGGGIDRQGLIDAFPSLQQVGESLRAQEARTEAGTVGGAKALLNQALFDLGASPRDFTPEQLDAMSRFIAQSGGAQRFEREIGPRLQELKQQKVLQETLGGGRGGGGAQRFGPGNFPTFEQLGALQSAGLGVAPTGAIAPLRPGQTQSRAGAIQGITTQLGLTGIRLPFATPEPVETPPGLDVLAPLFREAAGESPALLQFLFSQAEALQQSFVGGRRGEAIRGRREERASTQRVGRRFSSELRAVRDNLRRLERGFGQEPIDEAGIRRQENLRRQQERLRGEERRLRGKIRTTTTLGRISAQNPIRPSGTFEDFFGGRVEGLRRAFSQTPAGLQEEQRLTARAESDRRRALRGGGRTIFRRFGT